MHHSEMIPGIIGGPFEVLHRCRGSERILSVCPRNTVLYGGSDIIGQLLAGNSEYALAYAYVEFTTNAGGWSAPSYDRSGGKTYYDNLSAVPNTDYLRLPLAVSPQLQASDGNFSTNRARFFVLSPDDTGVHGESFTSGAGAAIVGGSLVASPTGLAADDICFNRFYFSTPVAKPSTGDFGVTFTATAP